MTERIEVELDGTDNLSDVAKKAAKGIDRLEQSIEDTDAALTQMNKAAVPAGRALEDVGSASEQAGSGLTSAGVGFAGFAANLASGAITFAVEKLAELATATAKFALTTEKSNRATKGLLSQVTDSPAELSALFEGLQQMAIDTGGNVSDLSAEFVRLRKEGKSAQQAADLLKLQADVKAATGSVEQATVAMDKYAAAIEGGASHAEAIEQTAEAFRVPGDGATASAASMYTLDGAMDRAKATLEKSFTKALEKAGPALEKLADAIAKMADSGVIEDVLMAIADAMNFVAENTEAVSIVFSVLHALVSPVTSALGNIISALEPLEESFSTIGSTASEALESVESTVSGWVSAGGELVSGFIKGIKDKISSAVAAAKDLGSEALASLKSVLMSKSPSKAAAVEGENLSAGFEQGIEPVDAGANLMPDGVSASIGDLSGGAASGGAASGGADRGAGISIESVVINAAGANSPEEYVTLTRRAFVEAFNDLQLSRGVAI